MPRLPSARPGTPLKIRTQLLPFGFWPMMRTTRRFGLQQPIFATNPLPIMRSAVKNQCATSAKPAALAFLRQAEDFYTAAYAGGVVEAKPLLLYYCFMNLAKAYILTRGLRSNVDDAQHGLSERLTP